VLGALNCEDRVAVYDAHKSVVIVAALIEDPRKRLLMVREAAPECYGLWNQPAGHVEANESIPDAFLREVKEETGCTVRIDSLARIHHFVEAAVLRFNFRATVLDPAAGPLADDVLETGWFSEEELGRMALDGRMRSLRTRLAIDEWLHPHSGAELIRTIFERR
jgi:8-oxo-dGTP pyrophosphatase MutT (NUDIX family)